MDKINILFFKYPPEPQYSVFEDDPNPSEICTDYGVETSKSIPSIGETRSHRRHEWVEGECKLIPTLWKVFDVQTCDRISFVHLSLDGSKTELEPMDPDRVLEVVISPEKTMLSWPEPGYEAAVDDPVDDCNVDSIFVFTPVNGYEVHVLWCSPAMALA